jgi:hypothetical protein
LRPARPAQNISPSVQSLTRRDRGRQTLAIRPAHPTQSPAAADARMVAVTARGGRGPSKAAAHGDVTRRRRPRAGTAPGGAQGRRPMAREDGARRWLFFIKLSWGRGEGRGRGGGGEDGGGQSSDAAVVLDLGVMSYIVPIHGSSSSSSCGPRWRRPRRRRTEQQPSL